MFFFSLNKQIMFFFVMKVGKNRIWFSWPKITRVKYNRRGILIKCMCTFNACWFCLWWNLWSHLDHCVYWCLWGNYCTYLNLPLSLQAHGRIVLQYVYKCFRSLDRQLWDIIYCTCAGYYMESSWKFLLGIWSNARLFKAQDLPAWNWLKTHDEPHTVRCDSIINK